MEIQKLYEMIELQPEIISQLESVEKELNLEQIDSCLNGLTERKTAAKAYEDLKTHLGEDAGNIRMLYCQLEAARRTYQNYQKKHISDRIFIDTMKCFTRFIEECGRKNGHLFFDRGWWAYRQASMSLFRIEALEYEFQERDGEPVIALHIPSNADLTAESVDESLKQAEVFFREQYPDFKYDKYTCSSWLLAPALKQLLSEESKIICFQKRFDILEENREDREFMEWLFQVPENADYNNLPEKTSLQKKAKNLLLDGGHIGSAYGIIRRGKKICTKDC